MAAITTLSILGIYALTFAADSNFALSKSSDQWSNFGSFVGGTLGPALSFLAFIAVLATIWLQAKQISAMQQQAIIEELQRLVASTSKGIDEMLNQGIQIVEYSHGPQNNHPLHGLMAAAAMATINASHEGLSPEALKTFLSNARNNILIPANMLAFEIAQLVACLKTYVEYGGSQVIADFYKNRYRMTACWLDTLEITSDSAGIQSFFDTKAFREKVTFK